MADGPVTGEVSVLDEIIGGAPDDVARQVDEALAVYVAASKSPQEEVGKATKLRGAFTVVMEWLLAKRLPELSDAQWLFLSTGSIGAQAPLDRGGSVTQVDLVPKDTYKYLVECRAAKANRPAWSIPILDFEDRVNAIARGEIVGLDSGSTRRKRPAKPLGADQLKDKVRGRLEIQVAGAKEAIGGVEAQMAAFAQLRDEKMLNTLKLNMEALKKYVLFAGMPGKRSEQERRLVSQVGERASGVMQSYVNLGVQLEKVGRDLTARARALDGKLAEVKNTRGELDKVEAGQASASAAFDPDTIAAIRKDEDTLASFCVKGAEGAENKVAFSGARVLVKEQWKDFSGPPSDYLATLPAVMAAIEKISKIHLNVFPRDPDGQFILPPIIIEPVRNYIEFFDDRIVMSFVSGEGYRKGPKFSFNPLEVQVLKACGHYLAKDSLYDYRGEINAGTFMGDYSGRVEKKTSVKWVGDDKKFSMGTSSQVVDSASRGEAVTDYADVVFSLGNGLMPPQKLSRRKLAVLLRYVTIESPERTVALTLMHVAQAETQEAKTTILKHGRTEEKSRELVAAAFADPQVAKTCGDKDFFLTKLFGKQ